MFKNRSKVLFVTAILATLYVIYLVMYFGGSIMSNDSSEAIGGAIATALIMPHMFLTGLGAIFSWVGFATRKSWAALAGAILYSVGAALFVLYIMFSLPLIILGFVGYSKQKKINQLLNNINNI